LERLEYPLGIRDEPRDILADLVMTFHELPEFNVQLVDVIVKGINRVQNIL